MLNTHRKRILFAIIFAFLVLAVAVLIQNFDQAKVEVVLDPAKIGANGPLVLQFNQEMNEKQIEEYLEIDPVVDMQFRWNGNDLYIYFSQPLVENATYTLFLKPGSQTIAGDEIKQQMSWEFDIRHQQIICLRNDAAMVSIIKVEPESKIEESLFETDQDLMQFAVSHSGEEIVFALENQQGGVDLWIMDRNGVEIELLLDCGKDRCIEPAWSPFDDMLAYSRFQSAASTGERKSTQKVWVFQMENGDTSPIVDDERANGSQTVWSDAGSRIAFFDQQASLIRIIGINSPDSLEFEVDYAVPGSWAEGDQVFLYTEDISAENRVYSKVYEIDLEGEKKSTAGLNTFFEESIFSKAVVSPDGNFTALSARNPYETNAAQLWVVSRFGEFGQQITDVQQYVHSAYSWDVYGEQLLYQRYNVTVSISKPEVMVWDRNSKESMLIIQNSAQPQWLP